MARITLKETITKKFEIPMETLYDLIENLTLKEREQLLERVSAKKVQLKPFKKGKIETILADFAATGLYEELRSLLVRLRHHGERSGRFYPQRPDHIPGNQSHRDQKPLQRQLAPPPGF